MSTLHLTHNSQGAVCKGNSVYASSDVITRRRDLYTACHTLIGSVHILRCIVHKYTSHLDAA